MTWLTKALAWAKGGAWWLVLALGLAAAGLLVALRLTQAKAAQQALQLTWAEAQAAAAERRATIAAERADKRAEAFERHQERLEALRAADDEERARLNAVGARLDRAESAGDVDAAMEEAREAWRRDAE